MTDARMNRRSLLLAGVGVAVGGCAADSEPGVSTAACVPTGSGGTFVLVHGSWVGAYTFADLDRRLTARGHAVFGPSLTG